MMLMTIQIRFIILTVQWPIIQPARNKYNKITRRHTHTHMYTQPNIEKQLNIYTALLKQLHKTLAQTVKIIIKLFIYIYIYILTKHNSHATSVTEVQCQMLQTYGDDNDYIVRACTYS